MANIVEQINDAIKSQVSTTLGASYSELDYVIDVAMNDFRNETKRYGVRPKFGADDFAGGIKGHYNANQEFEVILTHDYVNRDSDEDQRAKQFILLDAVDSILKDILLSKAGLPAIILNISAFIIEEPEFLDEDNLSVQRISFNVKYRQALNTP